MSESVPVDIPEPVPDWAVRYNAGDYPPHAVTGDAVALALDWSGGNCRLHALLVVRAKEPFAGLDAWPGGFMDWMEDADSVQTAIREMREETGLDAPEFVEALASYSRNGRDPRQFAGYRDEKTGEWIARGARVTTNAYLMLVRKPSDGTGPTAADDASEARWVDVYSHLPWEDLREASRAPSANTAGEVLHVWGAEGGQDRARRVHDVFGRDDWNEERASDRYGLLMEAGLVPEARRDLWGRAEEREGDERFGRPMAFDHRRILADALGRLRGKIKYMPSTLMALTGPDVTLDELQAACEAIAGRPLHRANFRRAVAHTGAGAPRAPRLVGRTGQTRTREARGPGVAPEIYRFLPEATHARLETSIRFPWLPLADAR
ncbi:NUDIX domain-containing protein [Longimicrobium sp.]|uniref:NUDIX domain-containing protein n=1 Tax=Longimicrobium sp. TaxID=2029185 RepID=UPI002ED79081